MGTAYQLEICNNANIPRVDCVLFIRLGGTVVDANECGISVISSFFFKKKRSGCTYRSPISYLTFLFPILGGPKNDFIFASKFL